MKITCFSCGTRFDCGADHEHEPCWCASKSIIPIESDITSCRCKSCFEKGANIPTLRCFRLYIAYDGTGFSGYQAQANVRTVEGELYRALVSIVGPEFSMQVAGRTDAGVHARGQVVSLLCTTRLDGRQLTLALASKLPKDMSVFSVDKMPIDFNARRHAVGKRYIYSIYQGLTADPFLGPFSLHVRQSLDIDAMKQAANFFIGEHDFASFRSSLCTAAHARRYIWHVGLTKHDALITIDVRGNAFCMNMVRIMVGTLIEVGKKRRSPLSIKDALMSHDRTTAGITARAHGLTLEQIYYPDDLSSAGIPADAIFPRYPVSCEENSLFDRNQIVYGSLTTHTSTSC